MSIITIAGENLITQKAQANQQLDIDTFIFANVPSQDETLPIDRNETLPIIAQRVHTQVVHQTGMINENTVVYSTVLESVTGHFEFNWVGLYSSINDTLIAIEHIPTTIKTKSELGKAGNTLNRNFGIKYSGISDLTGITVAAETWQLDFTARLSGMDKLTRQLASDMNGKDWFIENGFKVVPSNTNNTFDVLPGVGYVNGLRIEQEQTANLILQSYPQFIYVDAYFEGDASSAWKPKHIFTVTDVEKNNYIDGNGKQHYLFKLANITAADAVDDLRNNNGLRQQIENHKNKESGAHKASAISLAVLANVTTAPTTLQDAKDWYGIYLSEFIRLGDVTISDALNRALDYCRNVPYRGTKIIFPRGEFYKYDDDHKLGNLSHCVIDLNGSTVQRRSASFFSSETTATIPAGTSLNAREIYVADASKFKVGDYVFSIKGAGLDNISSDPRLIVSIVGNKITIAGSFYYKGTQYGSNTPVGAVICKRVNFLGGINNSFDGVYNDKIVLCNGELDGNAAGQPSNAWVFNAEIMINSNRGVICDMTFRNTAAECIVGHGVDVHRNQFFDMGGSCFHLSVHDNSLNLTGGSWFRNNQCERTNLFGQAASGHAEGLVTFSWGAGRLIVESNICKDGAEPFLGAFGGPTDDNPDKYLVVKGNILERFTTIMAHLAPDAVGVSITDNILVETGVLPQVQLAIFGNPSIICSNNISTGTTLYPTLQNVTRDQRMAIGDDVALLGAQVAVIGDTKSHDVLNQNYVPNPTIAQHVVQGSNVMVESSIRTANDSKRAIYTKNGNNSGTVVESWFEESQQLNYLVNPVLGYGGSVAWCTYNGGIKEHFEIDDDGAKFSGMQYGRSTYYGEKDVDGSWRVRIVGGDLVHEKRVNGVWVTKQTVVGS